MQVPLPKDATLEELQIPEAWRPLQAEIHRLAEYGSFLLMLAQFHTQT